MTRRQYFTAGFKDGIPICLGYIAVSFTFGIMAKKVGISIFDAVLISLTNVTSAGQFAGLSLIASTASYIEMAITQLIINLRYCLMSFSLSQKLEKGVSNGHRLAVAFGVTDEIFGVSASHEGRINLWNVSCGDHSTGKEKSRRSWRSDRSDGCEYVICSGSGTE